jgi:transcription elongation factor Elf1
MAQPTGTATGFPCPKCQNDKLSDVMSADHLHIVELKCRMCGSTWAVESRYAPASDVLPHDLYLNAPEGRVDP